MASWRSSKPLATPFRRNVDRDTIAGLVRSSAARNALDCALWDLEAKTAAAPVWQLAGLAEPKPLVTAYTLSLAEPAKMGGQPQRQPTARCSSSSWGRWRPRAPRRGAPQCASAR